MSSPQVCLHIGAMKTGTTYVQRRLGTNRDELAQMGIWYPRPWSDQVEAVRDILAMKGGAHLGSIEGRWDQMVQRIHSWDGERVILSVEFLSFADTEQVARIMGTLSPSQVTVVIGARDLARVLPAQWQTAVRNGQPTTYREYVSGLTTHGRSKSKRHFWKRQDIGRIAATWADVAGRENVAVVTVPPSGADPNELWRRMALAMKVAELPQKKEMPKNESLGPTATELLRRINARAKETDMSTWSYQHGVNRALSHQVLPDVPETFPRLRVPNEAYDWITTEAERVINEIDVSGVEVIGPVDDLRPVLDTDLPFVWPEEIPDKHLLAAAVAALTAFADRAADTKRQTLQSRRAKQVSKDSGAPS
jgi:hypothetical protein